MPKKYRDIALGIKHFLIQSTNTVAPGREEVEFLRSTEMSRSKRNLLIVVLLALITAACAPAMQEVEKVAVKGWEVDNSKVYDIGGGRKKVFSNLEGVFPNHNVFVRCTIDADVPTATYPSPYYFEFPGWKIWWPENGESPFGVNFEFVQVATVTWEVWSGRNDQGNLIFQKTDQIPKDEEIPKPFPTATRMP